MNQKFHLATLSLLIALLVLAGCSGATGDTQPGGAAQVAPSSGAATTNSPQLPPAPQTPSLDNPAKPAPAATEGPEQPIVPPSATTLTNVAVELAQPNPAVVWGAQDDNSLTLWLGYFVSQPSPHIEAAHQLVRWDAPLQIYYMSASPDHKSLALITAIRGGAEGIPNWMYMVDLTTNRAHHLPPPSNISAYSDFFKDPPRTIVGWLDNSRLVIESNWTTKLITTDGSYKTLPTNFSGKVVAETALAPDYHTLFSSVTNKDGQQYWLHDSEVQNAAAARELTTADGTHAIYAPLWSPAGDYISFLSPSTPDFTHLQLWLLDPKTGTQRSATSEDKWAAGATWLADGKSIAYLAADKLGSSTEEAWYEDTSRLETNVYLLNPTDLSSRPLTKFNAAHNSGLAWLPDGGYLLLSSTATGKLQPSIVAVSAQDGSLVEIVPSGIDTTLVSPLILR